jgi:predicted unusual protein kinase regulating ubiquinone biosynthesis (AarF/ABC1/UbiB family)
LKKALADNMAYSPKNTDGLAVPFGRLSRLARFGGMVANVAGGMFFDGVQQLASGKHPSISDLLMTPANALKVTHQLAKMRGAAMKIGQMISMDSGDFLPRELADILAQLRDDARHMPHAQLNQVLTAEWGKGWPARFADFGFRPIAAASIGQVHRAKLPDGQVLAIKVQYPGVRESIDSDVNNVASLLQMTGLLPAKLDIKPLLDEGRAQLHQEADYRREAEFMGRFAKLLAGAKDYQVPQFYPEFSTDRVLAMSYIESEPIEAMVAAPQKTRDRLATLLIDLLLRELFIFGLMQTDPNFANYRFNPKTKQLVLLDFGASQDISATLAASYHRLLQAILAGDQDASYKAMLDMGFIAPDMPIRFRTAMLDMMALTMEPLQHDGPFDFGNNDVAQRLRDKGMELAGQRELWHVPPANTVFIQRKLGGVYMLASRLRARVNVRRLMQKYVKRGLARTAGAGCD